MAGKSAEFSGMPQSSAFFLMASEPKGQTRRHYIMWVVDLGKRATLNRTLFLTAGM